jgi:uncharacterized protein YggE
MNRLLRSIVISTGLVAACAAISVADDKPVLNYIRVSGHGEVKAKPDIAIVNVSVATTDVKASIAGQKNAALMTKVMAAVKALGVAENDIQTSGYNLQPQYNIGGGLGGGKQDPPRIQGYIAQNNVQVTVRNLGNVGKVIDATLDAGANSFNGVSWDVADNKSSGGAIAAAVADARRKAEIIAKGIGATLGSAFQVEEGGSSPRPMPMYGRSAMAMDVAATPVAPGELTLTSEVTVMFGIAVAPLQNARAEADALNQGAALNYAKMTGDIGALRTQFGEDSPILKGAKTQLTQATQALRTTNVSDEVIMDALKSHRMSLLSARTQMMTRFTSSHPSVVEMDARITSIEQAIKQQSIKR